MESATVPTNITEQSPSLNESHNNLETLLKLRASWEYD